MKVNPDNATVAAVDLVVPGAGELMGGSQREENLEKLLERMSEMHVDPSAIDWYLDTRRYGGCVHSGFGMGFERLIMYLTGVDNIRDVIPYPRTLNTQTAANNAVIKPATTKVMIAVLINFGLTKLL